MKRSFNFTGRKRIRQADVSVTVFDRGDGAPASFDASVNLLPYDLPADAPVFLEAYRQTGWMRFKLGTVGNLKVPDDRRLTEFDSTEALHFRVRVIAPGENQKMLAEADKIPLRKPGEPGPRESLLPVEASPAIGHEVWRLDTRSGTDEGPVLQVNADIQDGNWRGVSSSPVFQALVFPAVLREILVRILVHDRHKKDQDDEDVSLDWRDKWLAFADKLSPTGHQELDVPDPQEPVPDEVFDWIDGVVEAFCRRYRFAPNFDKCLRGEL